MASARPNSITVSHTRNRISICHQQLTKEQGGRAHSRDHGRLKLLDMLRDMVLAMLVAVSAGWVHVAAPQPPGLAFRQPGVIMQFGGNALSGLNDELRKEMGDDDDEKPMTKVRTYV